MTATLHTRRGQTLTQMILIVMLVAVAALLAVTLFGNDVRGMFFGSSDSLRGGPALYGEPQTALARLNANREADRFGEAGGSSTSGSGPVDRPVSLSTPVPASSPSGPSALDRAIHGGLQTLLGQPAPNETTYIEIAADGGFAVPGAELGIPGSIAVGADGSARLTQNPDGTIDVTYGLGGRLGLEEAAGEADVAITAGGKRYGLGAEAGGAGGAQGGGSISFRFDPSRRGDMELLHRTLTQGAGSTGPELVDHVVAINGEGGLYAEANAHLTFVIEAAQAGGSATATTGIGYSRNDDGSWSRTEHIRVEVDGGYTVPAIGHVELNEGWGGNAAIEIQVVTHDDISSLGDLLAAESPLPGTPRSVSMTFEIGTTEDGWLYSEGQTERVTITTSDPAAMADIMAKVTAFGQRKDAESLQALSEAMQQNGVVVTSEQETTQTGGVGISGGIGGLGQELSGQIGISGTRGKVRRK